MLVALKNHVFCLTILNHVMSHAILQIFGYFKHALGPIVASITKKHAKMTFYRHFIAIST